MRIPAAAAATTATAAAVGVAAGVGVRAGRRWRAAEDPCGPDGLRLPEGEAFKVTTDDGAVLAGTLAG